MNRSFARRAAVYVALFTATSALADDSALAAQVEALRNAINAQRAQLESQAKLLESQQAQLEALTRQLAQSQVATQEVPKLTFTNARPTITAADGRSSIALRANVQLDSALYGESAEGPLNQDFRRGSVGASGNRETNAARDFSEGFYFRRARFGVEGTLSRDFNYRLLLVRRPWAWKSGKTWMCLRCERSTASDPNYSSGWSVPWSRAISARRNTRLKRSWQAADTCSSKVELTRSTDTSVSALIVAVRRAPRT